MNEQKGIEKRPKIGFIAFTDQGEALAEKIAKVLGGSVARSGRPQNSQNRKEYGNSQYTSRL